MFRVTDDYSGRPHIVLGVLALSLLWAIVLVAWPAHGQAQITVVDDFGRNVTLAAPAERVLSLAPHNTENLFSAGAGSKIVGVVDHSDYPPDALQISSVGSHAQVNIEAVIALQPDLVVAWETGNNREAIKKVAQLGFPVYYSEPRTFEDVIENIEELALLAGTSDDIEPSAASLRKELLELNDRYTGLPVIRAFYQVWMDPLMTLNGEHFISRVLELCGAENTFSHLPIIAPRISVEAVVQANPDIIITGRVTDTEADTSMWRKWTSLKAVANNNFIYVDSDVMHRHTARMIMGIRGLCEQIDQVRQAGL